MGLKMQQISRIIHTVIVALVVGVITGSTVHADADVSDIDPFVGHYIGRSITSVDDQVSKRDFDVTVAAREKGGFEVSWTTFFHRQDGSVKKKESTIAFRKTERSGIYASAQKRDMFGNQVPFDPMEGDPYVWARVSSATLSIFGLLVTDDGGYEIQAYHRTLTDTGMDLEFIRTREDNVVRRISGTLQRVDD